MASVFPDHGEGFAPIALPREEPVAQFALHGGAAGPVFFEPVGDFAFGLGGGESVEEAGVDRGALAGEAAPDRLRAIYFALYIFDFL